MGGDTFGSTAVILPSVVLSSLSKKKKNSSADAKAETAETAGWRCTERRTDADVENIEPHIGFAIRLI